MIQANHPRFSCTSDMSLIIYGIIFSGPHMHTDSPSGTVLMSVASENQCKSGEYLEYTCCNLSNFGERSLQIKQLPASHYENN